jgi:hypothetical protein
MKKVILIKTVFQKKTYCAVISLYFALFKKKEISTFKAIVILL